MRHMPLGLVIVLLTAGVAFAAPSNTDASCASCHEAVVDGFALNTHSRIASFETPGGVTGCASCHGDVSAHAQSGDPADIRGFGKNVQADTQACLSCHGRSDKAAFAASAHGGEVACSSCHTIHTRKSANSTCGNCHADVQAQFLAPSHHPVRQGGMTCASCHNVHSAQPGALAVEGRTNDLCVSCHSEKEGPFIFQHEPVEEDCMTCHQAHGAVADNLLQANEPFLCLQCHEFHFHAGLEARPEAPVFTVGGRQYPNVLGAHGYQRSFATKCTQCHTQIHGSDLPSQGISSRGRSLTR
ncbi:Cytochrome c-type protein NrfB [bacterium HR09]|nr:Cytochrome c-type protein NrfB [bacterium HR09]